MAPLLPTPAWLTGTATGLPTAEPDPLPFKVSDSVTSATQVLLVVVHATG